MTPLLLAPPALEPLSLAEARAWLRLDTTDEDATVTALIRAARGLVEQKTRRLLVTQQWRLVLDAWPVAGCLDLPLAPVRDILALRVFGQDGSAITVAPASVRLEAGRDPARIVIEGPLPRPARASAGIEIDLNCGYADDPAEVPEPLRHAVRLLVGRWFEHRGDNPAAAGTMPDDIALLIAPFRRPRL